MTISFVVPTYNREKLISKSIDSILKAFKNNFEIIIVDDNSSDNTNLLVKKKYHSFIKKKKIKYFYLKKNIGVTGAKNFGYKKSKYKFIVFLDSDDKFFGNHKEFLNFLQKYKNNPIVFFKCYENKVIKKKIVGKIFEIDKALTLNDYIINFSYGEALTVVNKTKCKGVLPYYKFYRGFEGIGCINLICKFGEAILVSKPFRIYNTKNEDRLSNKKNFYKRSGLIYKGYKFIWNKYRNHVAIKNIPILILRIIKFKILHIIYG